MSAFVEECRREWRRLGVPDLLAEEMATDLEADLAEAQAEGVSAAEILGESDPRRFAETWARERGLVSEPPPQKKSRKRLWIVLAIVLAVLVFFMGIAATALLATTTVRTSGPPSVVARLAGIRPLGAVRVPLLVGLEACRARRIALAAGLEVRNFPKRRCDALVVAQRPAPGTLVPRHAPQDTVTLRLRRRR
jgi:hypothetical protein